MVQDLYKILGVPRTATQDEIESAYRKAAKLYHPDINHESFAENIYRKINEAYDTLGDAGRRKAYDSQLGPSQGSEPAAPRTFTPPAPQPRAAQAMPPSHIPAANNGMGGDFQTFKSSYTQTQAKQQAPTASQTPAANNGMGGDFQTFKSSYTQTQAKQQAPTASQTPAANNGMDGDFQTFKSSYTQTQVKQQAPTASQTPAANNGMGSDFQTFKSSYTQTQSKQQVPTASQTPAAGTATTGQAPTLDGTSSVAYVRQFYTDQYRQQSDEPFTIEEYVMRKKFPLVVLASIVIIDLLMLFFGMRLLPGQTTAYMARSSIMVIISWVIFGLLRNYTKGVLAALFCSVICAILYAAFMVRIFLTPSLYPGMGASTFVRCIGVHFFAFYLVFFCSTQLLENGGFDSMRSRLLDKSR